MRKEEIKEIRERLGLSQTDFGDLIGVSLRTVQNYESGKNSPTGTTILKIQELGTKENAQVVRKEKDTSTGVDSVLNDPYILKEIELRALKKAFYWMQNPEAFKEYLETEGR